MMGPALVAPLIRGNSQSGKGAVAIRRDGGADCQMDKSNVSRIKLKRKRGREGKGWTGRGGGGGRDNCYRN